MEGKIIRSILFCLLFLPFIGWSQTEDVVLGMEDLKPDSSTFSNIHVKPLSSDSLSSTFAIWVKLKVKMHKHVNHTEHVYVLKGKGNMTVGDSTVSIKKGDLVIIPMDTWHGVIVTSKKPLKVISVQSPQFKGLDRVFKTPQKP